MAARRPSVTPLAGRAALVTGATGTLGRAVAEAYIRAGAQLLLSGRSEDRLRTLAGHLSERFGTDIPFASADLTRPDDVGRLALDARHRLGGLDVLVNAAAVIGPIGPAWENDAADWARTLQVNLHAAVQLCQLCIPYMPLAPGRGKIINVSGGGAASPRPRFSAYAAAKAALVRFSETLAIELADRPIDVNCVAPGVLGGALAQAIADAGPHRAGRREYDTAMMALRSGADDPAQAAELCVFLGSSDSDEITGKLISAKWDPWPALGSHRADLDGTDVYTLRRIVPRDRGFDWSPT
jgi:NAD(P)-dependent dehydrogenase (short-subunit alcohol dehydrogenase family)